MAKTKVSFAPSVRRLPSYLHIIRQAQRNGDYYISGTIIANELNLEPIQVRKDLAITGIIGKPKKGYPVEALVAAIEHYLGWDESHEAVLVGAGNLGSALMGYQEFQLHGLHVIAAFDTDPAKVGGKIHGVPILSMDSLEENIKLLRAEIAILTVPSPFAQATAETLVKAGISSIWNFTNTKLKVPDSVVVQREDLSSGYAILSVMMQTQRGRLS
ncbi:MAG TPA: redox-sensing transcriptional repressor Rex [Spirochaetales bacterium]|nr:redox-sensing transcriptional repressor Rex [Spirochaetales bacterium]HRY53652.1 redox-sensing transcriptional repressor Rex [Spirochaetia bacterium]HRZ65006.1 redox-sensing transcriptional repressor Rex [Spirochaetia bacterium]